LKNKKENGKMKRLLWLIIVAIANHVLSSQWDSYVEFESDATNALAKINILISDSYTNQLHLCRSELDSTNEVSSAALLMLSLSDDAKSNHIREYVGNTNCLCRVAWFLTCPNQERTIWQKICAITILSTSNKNTMMAAEYFNVATNVLQYWDNHPNCFLGGELYQSIARYFGASELNPRMCMIFATAVSAKKAGMTQQFTHYLSMLPLETREFLSKENW
jgi:hypothetical protein